MSRTMSAAGASRETSGREQVSDGNRRGADSEAEHARRERERGQGGRPASSRRGASAVAAGAPPPRAGDWCRLKFAAMDPKKPFSHRAARPDATPPAWRWPLAFAGDQDVFGIAGRHRLDRYRGRGRGEVVEGIAGPGVHQNLREELPRPSVITGRSQTRMKTDGREDGRTGGREASARSRCVRATRDSASSRRPSAAPSSRVIRSKSSIRSVASSSVGTPRPRNRSAAARLAPDL